ncbi:flavin reductase family protein [Kribbella sandramycini]|uniref:Flavin reductase (DIM6/NTAB) family NADH-FMN oxidoreductase RutF n=1 Tax=Kribbella sandramycini TaxID=60450 RepID=A0A7Y4P2A4_9ACTN|nr:flavin reductase (DIM6/NTAB) family NADH-FMN oxidoreductase RutF [Kribbella sandramycini]NOL42919.1 flavin reductase family protein [Kribbella sandramycini]
MRLELDPDEVGPRKTYATLNAIVIPRPIAWVSTISADGILNLAPHSFYTVASVRPPMVQFTSVGRKDTLTNIEATREFVINLAPAPLFEQINASATDFPPEISEFDAIGVTPEPSRTITAPRVAESPAALECTLHTTIPLGDCTLVIGQVRSIALTPTALTNNHPTPELLNPLARLDQDNWSTLGPLRQTPRIPYPTWPAHFTKPH